MNNPWAALPMKSNLGSRINLENARNKLTIRMRRAQELANAYHRNGMGPFFREMNREVNKTRNLLVEVHKRLKLRHQNLGVRHFKTENLDAVLAVKKRYSKEAATFHLYLQEVESLMRKYHIPRGREEPWDLAFKMIKENKLARKQVAHKYGLHWQIQAAQKRRDRNSLSRADYEKKWLLGKKRARSG
jgi:hypothetical protein